VTPAMQVKRWKWGAFGGVVLVMSACDAQVGPEYAGEPLMSLRGQVVLAGENVADVTPVIAFNTETGYAVVNAEVSGEFPAEFRLDVVEPPPPDALYDYTEGTGRIAYGILAVASRDHSERIPHLSSQEEEVCSEDEQTCTRKVQKCTSDGDCFTRTLSCSNELCPLVYESGDARVAQDHDTSFTEIAHNLGDVAYGVSELCNAEFGCYRTIRRCDVASAGPHSFAWSDGSIDRCELVSETADSGKLLADILEHVAIGYVVVYLTHAHEVPGFGLLGSGYHLIQSLKVSDEAWLSRVNCQLDARIAAVDAYNEANGTEYLPYDTYDDGADAEIETRTQRLEASCPSVEAWRVVESPLDEDLTFVIGSGARASF
jgi:hypothetical protein